MGTRMLRRILERVKCDKGCKMLSTEPRSEDAVSEMWLILFGGSSKAEEAERWFSVRSSVLPSRIQVPSCPYLEFRIPTS